MKARRVTTFSVCLFLFGCGVCGALAATAPPAKAAARTDTKSKTAATPARNASAKSVSATTNATAPAVIEIPKSVFVVPANAKEGQDPFFPAVQEEKVASNDQKAPRVDISALVLNGITSPPKRMAMINGRTFEPGETGEVKSPDRGADDHSMPRSEGEYSRSSRIG